MKVTAYVCPKCGDKVFSRARHDYRSCRCEDISVDGGFDYNKIGYHDEFPKSVVLEIDATIGELYYDWNNNIDEFGIIDKNGKPYIPIKYIFKSSGQFNSWDICDREIKELIEKLNELKNKHPNCEIRFNIESDYRLTYKIYRLETDKEYKKRVDLIPINRINSRKIKERIEKEAETEEKDRLKFQQIKVKYGW